MIDLLWSIALVAIAIISMAIGASTLRHIRDEAVPSLSRTSQRLVSRQSEPIGFWRTRATGLIWFLLGAFLFVVYLGDLLGLF